MNKKIGILIALFLLIPSLCFGAATDYYVKASGCAGDDSGTSWTNCFGHDENTWEADLEANAEAGDRYFVMQGTYTLTSDLGSNTRDGTSTDLIKLIGVKTGTTAEPPTGSDWAYGTDRPLLDDGANDYRLLLGDYYGTYNFRTTLSGINSLRIDTGNTLYNVYCLHEGTNRCVYTTDDLKAINCEFDGVSSGIRAVNAARIVGCYIHDSTNGIDIDGYRSIIIGNVIDTVTKGVDLDNVRTSIINNTLYNATTGIDGAADTNAVIINNIFDENTAPVIFTANYDSNFIDYNSWDGDASGNTNVTVGPHAVNSDITLTDPGSGDFTIPDSSAVEGVGVQVNTNVGVTGDYNWNMGVDQTDTQAGGASVTVGYGGLR